MPRHGKRYRQAAELVDAEARLSISDAVDQLVQFPPAKFDETVELHMRLGVDPTHQDQQVRGTLSLPHGTGRTIRVIAFATGDGAEEAREAGADEIGTDDLAKRIQGGWLDFEAAVAMPDTMRIIGPLGRILGPRGLMPNARAGTVTNDVGRVVKDLKAGRVEFRVERLANIHVRAGKVSNIILQWFLAMPRSLVFWKPNCSLSTRNGCSTLALIWALAFSTQCSHCPSGP